MNFPACPVAIGGMGGSGTRVVAALLQNAGYYIGDCFNTSRDNLWFTLLFKRARWVKGNRQPAPGKHEVEQSIHLFLRAMTQGLAGQLTQEDMALLKQLRADLPPLGTWQVGASSKDLDDLQASVSRIDGGNRPWGWKEPNTHIFLPHLNNLVPGLCYIHVVRDGFDMAFSTNTWQAQNWSHLFGLVQDPDQPMPWHQLRYWTVANQRVMDYGTNVMGGRFLVIHYEDLCERPKLHWQRICAFLGLPTDLAFPKDLIEPTSVGRSKLHDFSDFPEADLIRARALQARVELNGKAHPQAVPKTREGIFHA